MQDSLTLKYGVTEQYHLGSDIENTVPFCCI